MSTNSKQNLVLITFFFTVALATLLYLGKWQLDRLTWKESLIQEIRPESLSYQPINQAILSIKNAKSKTFYPVLVDGTFDHNFSFYVGPRTHKGQAGQHLFTPLQISNGPVILVNRGWVSQHDKDISRPQGLVSFKGFMRFPEQSGNFTPHNKPYKDEWYSVDIEQIRDRLKIKGFKHWLRLEPMYVLSQDTDDTAQYPIPVNIQDNLKNPHLGYALTWFSLALILMLMYLRFIYKWLEQR